MLQFPFMQLPGGIVRPIIPVIIEGSTVRWKSTVAFAESPLSIIHLGYRGFLEYFHSTFQGPEQAQ